MKDTCHSLLMVQVIQTPTLHSHPLKLVVNLWSILRYALCAEYYNMHCFFVLQGTPVTVTKFDQVDKDGDTAFGFTVKVLRGANEWESFKYYFVPGSFLIGIMLANTPQYVFEVCS